MSVRAYRVNKCEYNSDPSFNLWHDTEFLDFLATKGEYDGYIQENGGFIEVSVETLKEAINKAKDIGLEDYHIKSLQQDIEFAEKKGDNWVQYICY